jgi:hypothetical protein
VPPQARLERWHLTCHGRTRACPGDQPGHPRRAEPQRVAVGRLIPPGTAMTQRNCASSGVTAIGQPVLGDGGTPGRGPAGAQAPAEPAICGQIGTNPSERPASPRDRPPRNAVRPGRHSSPPGAVRPGRQRGGSSPAAPRRQAVAVARAASRTTGLPNRANPSPPRPASPGPTVRFESFRTDPLNREPPVAFAPPRIDPANLEPTVRFESFRTDPLNREPSAAFASPRIPRANRAFRIFPYRSFEP